MTQEFLFVKLCELDNKIGQVHNRIHLSEAADHAQILAEVEALQKECAKNEIALRNKLHFSKAHVVGSLAESCDRVEEFFQEKNFENPASDHWGDTFSAEEKVLLAEYALDFAMQAADNALLISLKAMDAQMTLLEKEGERIL